MKTLRENVEELAGTWEAQALSYKRYASLPKSSGINAELMLRDVSSLEVRAYQLRRAIESSTGAA